MIKQYLKEILKKNDSILILSAYFYNIYFLNFFFPYKLRGVFLKKTKAQINGINNKIICGKKTRLYNCTFYINGDNSVIRIGENCIFKNLELWIEDNNGIIDIGKNTTIEGGHFAATEGKKIVIGTNCMFSHNAQIRNGDSHPIFDLDTGVRINEAVSIEIGNNVWFGTNVTILKGSNIAENSIIGTGSIVSGSCGEKNAIYVGIPAKKVRGGIRWERLRNVISTT